MTPTRSRIDTLPKVAAVLMRIAAIALMFLAPVHAALADGVDTRPLAVELRVAFGDLARFETPDLSPAHTEGLGQRIRGALGLLPWLLVRAGHPAAAEALAVQAQKPLDADGRAALRATLGDLVARFPLDLAERAGHTPPGPALAEAAAIHEAYCAGCHDAAGNGDPDLTLPARDLRLMAREAPAELFLARLTLGIKGDETIAFRSPVTDRQLLALLALYRAGWDD